MNCPASSFIIANRIRNRRGRLAKEGRDHEDRRNGDKEAAVLGTLARKTVTVSNKPRGGIQATSVRDQRTQASPGYFTFFSDTACTYRLRSYSPSLYTSLVNSMASLCSPALSNVANVYSLGSPSVVSVSFPHGFPSTDGHADEPHGVSEQGR